jgi:hypothetical protein
MKPGKTREITPKRTTDNEEELTLKKLFGKRRARTTAALGLAAAAVLWLNGIGPDRAERS